MPSLSPQDSGHHNENDSRRVRIENLIGLSNFKTVVIFPRLAALTLGWRLMNRIRSTAPVTIKLKECPECRTLVWRTHRYSNVVKRNHSQVEAVKEKMLGHDFAKKGFFCSNKEIIWEQYMLPPSIAAEPRIDGSSTRNWECIFVEGEYERAITHLSLLVERSSFASSLVKHIESARALGNVYSLLEKHYRKPSRRAGDLIAIQAVVQWASALTLRKEFTSAVELCDAVLGRDPHNGLAKEIRANATKGEVQLVVQAMAADVGGRGHWYTCPNGHLYTIGECGGAMQLSKCSDCKADVGGEQHRLTADNKYSNIDGSERAAWPGN